MNYIAVDLETTGLNPKTDRIIEIGAIKVQDGVITEEFETFVNPRRILPERITELTGITDEMLKDAPIREEAMDLWRSFIEDSKALPILGHNILFDFAFLKRAMIDTGSEYSAEGIDTLKIARAFLPELPSRALPALCGHYGILTESHRAKADAVAAHELYHILWKEFGNREAAGTIFAPGKLNYQVKRQRPITARQKERLKKMAAIYQIELPYEVDSLTKNEADRIIDRLRAAFGSHA